MFPLTYYLATYTESSSDCTCDVCSRGLGGSRIICADCHSSRWDTVDFCGDSTCHTHSVTRSDLKSDHLPTHSFVKIRTNIQWHDIKKLRQNAATVLERWRLHPISTPEMPLNKNDGKKSPVPEQPPAKCIHCFVCQTSLTKAFWYCAECAGELFLFLIGVSNLRDLPRLCDL